LPRDYYEILGVEKSVDQATLKKAYKKAARKYHPDLNQDDPSAEEKFKEAAEAFEVLSNDDKRQIYDQYGHEGLRGRGYDPNFTDLGDIFSAFSDLFGGGFADMFGGGRRRGGRRGPRRGADLEYPLSMTFMEAAHGMSRTVQIPIHKHCDVCGGDGLEDGASRHPCGTCGGAGQVIQAQGFLRIRTVCPTCRGKGEMVDPEDECTPCDGSGRVADTAEIDIRVPAGSYSGLQIRHPGRGEVGDPGGPHGDLFVTLSVESHEVFKRDGAAVYVTVPVPYPVMCLGGEITIPTVHGEESFDVPRATESGRVFVLRGKGIARLRAAGTQGDHHLRLVVDVPTRPSEEEEELLRKLADVQDVGVREKGFWQGLFQKLTS